MLRDYTREQYSDDVDVRLVHRGTNRTIMSDVGGVYGFEDITIKLDGEAPNFLSACDQLTSGRFKPTNIDEGPDYPDYFYDAVSSPIRPPGLRALTDCAPMVAGSSLSETILLPILGTLGLAGPSRSKRQCPNR